MNSRRPAASVDGSLVSGLPFCATSWRGPGTGPIGVCSAAGTAGVAYANVISMSSRVVRRTITSLVAACDDHRPGHDGDSIPRQQLLNLMAAPQQDGIQIASQSVVLLAHAHRNIKSHRCCIAY